MKETIKGLLVDDSARDWWVGSYIKGTPISIVGKEYRVKRLYSYPGNDGGTFADVESVEDYPDYSDQAVCLDTIPVADEYERAVESGFSEEDRALLKVDRRYLNRKGRRNADLVRYIKDYMMDQEDLQRRLESQI